MDYEDILDLPRPLSAAHDPMPIHDRAAQFAPFAALDGHAAAIDDTAKAVEGMFKK